MAPSAENEIELLLSSESESSEMLLPPSRNVTFAVNYELPMVEQFLEHSKRERRRSNVDQEMQSPSPRRPASDFENDVPNVLNEQQQNEDKTVSFLSPEGNRRVSTREKNKRDTPVARNRVRYDMQLVPVLNKNPKFLQNSNEAPFLSEETVLWMPSKRSEWEDCVSEMTALCTQAAIRRYTGGKFKYPLSRDYIRDRIDIDDPLIGYQLRHKTGGWLQGFILFTNFTTWTHGFHWDSTHPESGLKQESILSQELEALPRSGDPVGGGIVFQNIAEISLLGGLGCGEILLQMALSDIRSRPQYQYVVLQATDESKAFYSKYGFERVGAICQYGNGEVAGYRHWTHANESQRSLELHGGPSFMMCLKLNDEKASPVLEQMLKLRVDRKPTVEQLGASSTPGPKARRPTIEMVASFDSISSAPKQQRKRGRRRKSPPSTTKIPGKRSLSDLDQEEARIKRPKVEEPKESALLAVAPAQLTSPPQPPPKQRLRSRDKPVVKTEKPVVKKTPTKKATPKKAPNSTSKADSGRIYHSIRGVDGKFVRVVVVEPLPPPKLKKKLSTPPPVALPKKAGMPSNPASLIASLQSGKSVHLDEAALRKQKVKSYPRNKDHFYNRVVKRKDEKSKSYFVLEYDESSELICIVPMEAHGALTGRREGRPRYQCLLSNPQVVPTADYKVVKSAMVMKTPFVAAEAWDICESNDVNFETRYS